MREYQARHALVECVQYIHIQISLDQSIQNMCVERKVYMCAGHFDVDGIRALLFLGGALLFLRLSGKRVRRKSTARHRQQRKALVK